MNQIPAEEHAEHHQRQNISQIGFGQGRFRHGESLAGVHLVDEAVVAPAHLGDAEEQIDQRAEGHQVIAQDEVLEIENRRADAHRVHAREHREAHGAGQRQQDHRDRVDQAGGLHRNAF